ncbi:MAG: hypothetical protein U5K38_17135 [Woeseiaceae bacterium]|nr:hypothetical protein [Woeseiaceae bacterium]
MSQLLLEEYLTSAMLISPSALKSNRSRVIVYCVAVPIFEKQLNIGNSELTIAIDVVEESVTGGVLCRTVTDNNDTSIWFGDGQLCGLITIISEDTVSVRATSGRRSNIKYNGTTSTR